MQHPASIGTLWDALPRCCAAVCCLAKPNLEARAAARGGGTRPLPSPDGGRTWAVLGFFGCDVVRSFTRRGLPATVSACRKKPGTRRDAHEAAFWNAPCRLQSEQPSLGVVCCQQGWSLGICSRIPSTVCLHRPLTSPQVEYLPLKAVEKECIGLKLRPGSGSCVVFSCAIARPAVELEEHWFKDVVASVLLSERALLPQDTVARFRSDGTGQVHQYPVSCDML